MVGYDRGVGTGVDARDDSKELKKRTLRGGSKKSNNLGL